VYGSRISFDEDFNQTEFFDEETKPGRMSSDENLDLNFLLNEESKPGCFLEHENEKLIMQEWEVNVVVRFDINPANVIEFEEDSKSKRLIVAKTKDGLNLLKDLPILAVDEKDVTNLDCNLLEKMLVDREYPVVMKFGQERVEAERSSVVSTSSRHSIEEDHISFLGNTTFVTYEDIDESTNRRNSTFEVWEEEDSKDYGVSPDDEKLELEADLQPISVEGAHGDMSNWSWKCKERAKIITELLDTEKSYIKGLEELKKNFLDDYVEPLQKSLNVDISPFKTKVESLIYLHENIYEKLCSAENICKVFQQEFRFLKMYPSYVKGYEETITKLREASKKRRFKQLFETGKGGAFQDPLVYFNQLGITIIQRPPRYILLLQQLKKKTPKGHSMYDDLEKALTEIEGTCGSINEYESKTQLRFIEISKSIDYKTLSLAGVPQLLVPWRRLIREGAVGIKTVKQSRMSFIRRGNQEKLLLEKGRIVMCNDMLIILCGRKNRVVRVLRLRDIEVEVIEEPRKPSNTKGHSEKVYEVALKKKSVDVIYEPSEKQQKNKSTPQELRIEETLGLAGGSCFSIYLSTRKDAESWKDIIVKYSTVNYVN